MTTAQIEALRDRALAAYEKALDAASYTVNSGGTQRSLTRQELEKLRSNYEYWESCASEANGESRRVKFIQPRY